MTMTAAFDLQSHRGARGLLPENTLAGFARAIALGVTTLETDLAITRDGVVVLSHDPGVNPVITRGPDARWLPAPGPAIVSVTLDELRRFDVGRIDPASAYARQFPDQLPVDGARIPTLDELFALPAATARPPRYNLEIKTSPERPHETVDPVAFARAVVDTVREAGVASRTTIQSFDWRGVIAARKLAPELETSCLTMDTPEVSNLRNANWLAGIDPAEHGGSVPWLVAATGSRTWSPYWRNLDAAAVAQAHGLGIKVVPWTVNAPADMAGMIDLRVDGLITDYPDRALQVLASKGIAAR